MFLDQELGDFTESRRPDTTWPHNHRRNHSETEDEVTPGGEFAENLRHHEHDENPEQYTGDGRTADDDDTEEQQLKLLYKGVHQLNDIEKALVFLYLEEKDYREISETLGISEVNARVKMNRVKKKLRTILNP